MTAFLRPLQRWLAQRRAANATGGLRIAPAHLGPMVEVLRTGLVTVTAVEHLEQVMAWARRVEPRVDAPAA